MTGYPITSPLLPVGIATDTYTLKTRLPSNLKPTTRECVHLVTRGQFWSRDKDSGHTIRSAVAENLTLRANFMSLYFIEPELLPIEFLNCENRDFRPFLLL